MYAQDPPLIFRAYRRNRVSCQFSRSLDACIRGNNDKENILNLLANPNSAMQQP